jgi:glycosyltransferase involved in cell wall biosynthesis
MEEFKLQVLERLKAIEDHVETLEAAQARLQSAYATARVNHRRLLLRPPMWTWEQHLPRSLDLQWHFPTLPGPIPKIAIVTPSFNHARFLGATIDSVLNQNFPNLFYHVQDGNSPDGTVKILQGYGDRISWRSEPDQGQSDAINQGFSGLDSDIMAYLNSDDTLLPGTLAYVTNFFKARPDVDVVYGNRIFINYEGLEIGRAVLPAHSKKALLYAGYIPQETMFWRRRVWDTIGPMDLNFHYALDWDFMLRAQAAGFKFARAPRFLACFRVHDQQKTTRNYDVGRSETTALRRKYLGYMPSQWEIYRAIAPYLVRQCICHWSYKIGFLRQ